MKAMFSHWPDCTSAAICAIEGPNRRPPLLYGYATFGWIPSMRTISSYPVGCPVPMPTSTPSISSWVIPQSSRALRNASCAIP